RGLLQFENVSYGIEPLGYSPAFEHFVYRMSDANTAVINSLRDHFIFQPLSAAARSPKYLEVYVVLDKALYNYMGSDKNSATHKIIQVFNLVNNMFNPLNVTVVLSSLEFWTEENKISTAGEADDLLQRFLQWKQSYLALRSYGIAYLLVYRDQAAFVGATALGKACQRDAAGAVAVVRCCLSPQLLYFRRVSGAKAFSSCSIEDFEAFLRHDRGTCLFHRPHLTGLSYRRAAVCGNGVVEPGEQCDCGVAEVCSKDKCCTKTCRFKPGVQCSSGLCCNKCQFKPKNSPCRPPADAQCDLAEFCNGSSASCPPDLYVQDGHDCERSTGYCYKGRCRSPDLQCRQLYGRASKNAPVACYEELNSQRDRFGHCGFQPRQGYKSCAWRNLKCGKLICTYPYSTPFPSDAAAVLYVQVREHLCVSLDY
ncbi:ADA32 protein, partial [Podilymbus podiceps]|nr:ADA32 protein [Podilymbus podiceps]